MKQLKKKTWERATDRDIKEVEKRLKNEYKKASKELTAKFEKQMASFKVRDEEYLLKVKSGDMTQEAYMAWREKALLNNSRMNALINELAKDMSNVNQTATAIINGKTANVFAECYNYQMYEIETGANILTAFGLYDKNTVAKLATVPTAKTKIAKDLMWNNRKIRSAITQGILQGESIPKIAKRIKTVARMNNSAAVRNARTLITSAENSGRMEGLKYAESIGIKTRKMWVATLDNRTRDSHAMLDGEIQDIDVPFSNGLMFPCDMDATDPAEIYNCRCTMISVIDDSGVSANPEEVTRASNMGDMSYEDWKKEHES